MQLKKISRQEAEQLNRVPLGKQHPVRAAIDALASGEILQIPRTSFTWKGKTPKIFCDEISKKSKKQFSTSWLTNKSGWTVERVDGENEA